MMWNKFFEKVTQGNIELFFVSLLVAKQYRNEFCQCLTKLIYLALTKEKNVLQFAIKETNNSFLFSIGVLYPRTAIGILLDLSKYFLPLFLKSSREKI